MTVPPRLTAALADHYHIERELGQGGMATVYLAQDLKHDRKVAIKVLREDLTASLGGGRFLREIKIAAQLQHPNILPLLDSGESDGFLFYVMPYVAGQSLRERLAREGELPVHEAVRLITEVVDALAHAHEHGVVHRDIKPDNVMLSGRHALVMDFGVAKAISEATGRNTVTTLGVAVGTPTYMSPEQAAADPNIDHRSDIYAVGVMAYELLSGRPPFVGATPQQVLAAHVTEAPDPVTKRRPAISPALDAIILRCLAKRPADRFQTASDLLAQLEPLATPSGGMTPTTTRPVKAVRARRSVPWVPVAAVVAMVVVVAAVAFWRNHTRPGGTSATHAIAVLPFENATKDTASDYLADGMANDVRSELTKVPRLIVKARTSSEAARGKSIHDAGALLSADVVLEGAFRRAAGQTTVTVDLVNVSDEAALWSGNYVLPPDGNFTAAQDSITTAVVRTLHLQPTTASDNAQTERGTTDLAAYNLYLKGMFLFAKRGADNLRGAIAYFHDALARDSTFARAYAGLAMTLSVEPSYVEVGDTALDEAGRMARRALALDSNLVDARLALANAFIGELQSRQAEREFAIALAQDPRNATGHQWHGDNLSLLGQMDDAVREGQLAMEEDPLSAVAANDLAYTLVSAGRFNEAIQAAHRALELDPTFPSATYYLAEAFAYTEHPDSAEKWFDAYFHADTLAPQARAAHVWSLAIAGRWSDAQQQLDVMQRTLVGGSRDFDLALADVALGNKSAALDALERSAKARSVYLSNYAVGCDPAFDLLKSEPRFVELVKEIGQVGCSARYNSPFPPHPASGGT